MGSILNDVKKVLGIESNYTAFDTDILMHINSVFATLNQLGIGPDEGYVIEDSTPTWAAFIGTDPRLNSVKTYIYLKVRFYFDPPTTSYLIEAMNQQSRELEWRLNSYRESTQWTNPVEADPVLDTVLDGGAP